MTKRIVMRVAIKTTMVLWMASAIVYVWCM